MPLPWFRRQKASAEQAPLEAAVPTAAPDPPITPEPAVAGPDAQPTPARKRRRGSRGGRGRKKKPGTATTTAVAETTSEPQTNGSGELREPEARRGAKPDAKPEAKSGERRSRTPRQPRRPAPRRAPLPKARRELLVSVDPGEKRVAATEDGVVAEVYLERPEHRSIAGNIYLGTVDNVLPGMEAAFVEIGLEKNGFLYVDEIVGPELEGRRGARKIQDLIQRGQTVLVQAVKDPMKTKGARLTTEISLPGRFVVFVPQGDGLGVSRRLDDDERNRLKAIVKEIAPPIGGVIVRTAAEGASAEDVARDLDFLRRLWSTIETSAKKAQAPALIYQEAELPLRVTRDLFTGDFERLLVDHDRTYKRIVGYLKKTSPHMVERVTRYKEREPLFEAFGVEQEIRSTLNRRVDLPSGGYLIFDYAEAFTVIDVNTGRFVGSRSKRNGPGRLEDTITKNNLEAVREVVRQLRLRDIGGIIVIDFIDMANPKNRQQVEDALRLELERDRTKTYVVEISPLGLVEMTRQNVTDGPREVMTRKCPTCDGDGIIVSEGTAAVEVERLLRALVTPGSRAKAFKVELNAKVAALLVGPDGSRLRELEEVSKRRFFFVGLDDVHSDHLRVLEQGTVEKLAPTAPVEIGQRIELKLGEVGLHDGHAGAGKVKGFEVVVAEAARLVGKKVEVEIVAVMDEVAYAVLVGSGEAAAPITAEAEAEKPTRTRRAIPSTASEADEDGADEDEEDTDEDEADESDESVDEPVDEAVDEEQAVSGRSARAAATTARSGAGTPRRPAKPRTAQPAVAAEAGEDEPAKAAPARRPRKPAAAATAAAVEAAEETPEQGDGETAAAPKKRTRRGTRGGRNRKRKTPAGAAPAEDGEPAEPTEPGEPGVAPAEIGHAEVEQPAAAVIHLPSRELDRNGDEPEAGEPAGGESRAGEESPARPATRRSSRGGRNRRRKPAAAPAEDGKAATESPAEVLAAAAPDGGVWEYTPMSEWEDEG